MEYTKERLLEALLRNIYPCEMNSDGQVIKVKLNVDAHKFLDTPTRKWIHDKTQEEDFDILLDVAIKSGKGEPIFDE